MAKNHYWQERILSHAGPFRVVVDRVRESHRSTYVVESGVRLTYRPWKGDQGVITEVWKDHVYPTPRHGDVVLDVGAHIGVYSTFALSHVGVSGKVISIEPDPRNVRLLKLNLVAAGGPSEVHDVAVSDAPGTMEIHHHALYSATTHTGPKLTNDVDTVSVRVSTIDEICAPLTRLDLIKMDIEGSELRAFKGGLATLRRFRPRLALEYHRPEMGSPVEEVIGLLEGEGYFVVRKGGIQGILTADFRGAS